MYSEVNKLLYFKNRFRFSELFIFISFITNSAHIVSFLHQIESQASLICYICILFSIFNYSQSNSARLQNTHIKNLNLVQDIYTNIKILELLILSNCANYALRDSSISAKTLDLLNTYFKHISFSKRLLSISTYISNRI